MPTLTQIKQEAFKNKAIKKAYDELETEFAIIDKLIQVRAERRMTQASLAKKMKTRQSAISRFEQGKYHPTLDFYHRLSAALGVEMKVTIR